MLQTYMISVKKKNLLIHCSYYEDQNVKSSKILNNLILITYHNIYLAINKEAKKQCLI